MVELGSDGALFVRPFLSVTVAIVVLFIGKALNGRIGMLREYNIPEPVTGGLLFALAFGVVYAVSGIKISFELTARDVLLVYFFTTIGMNARFSDLRTGGRPLVILLVITVAFRFVQNLVAVGAAWLMGFRPVAGLLAGSISLLGGHGTAIAWAPVLANEHGVAKALEVGVVCATAGLVMASLAGGPVACYLVRRHALEGPAGEQLDVSVRPDDAAARIDYFAFLHAILGIHVCGALGILATRRSLRPVSSCRSSSPASSRGY
jgi:ESS family glutamate:Na+ symporter